MSAVTKRTSCTLCLDMTEDLDVEDDTSQSEDHLGKKTVASFDCLLFLTHLRIMDSNFLGGGGTKTKPPPVICLF